MKRSKESAWVSFSHALLTTGTGNEALKSLYLFYNMMVPNSEVSVTF